PAALGGRGRRWRTTGKMLRLIEVIALAEPVYAGLAPFQVDVDRIQGPSESAGLLVVLGRRTERHSPPGQRVRLTDPHVIVAVAEELGHRLRGYRRAPLGRRCHLARDLHRLTHELRRLDDGATQSGGRSSKRSR